MASSPSLKRECSVCWDIPEDRIFQCRNGHIFCEECLRKFETQTCPVCRDALRKFLSRNLSLGDINCFHAKTMVAVRGCQE